MLWRLWLIHILFICNNGIFLISSSSKRKDYEVRQVWVHQHFILRFSTRPFLPSYSWKRADNLRGTCIDSLWCCMRYWLTGERIYKPKKISVFLGLDQVTVIRSTVDKKHLPAPCTSPLFFYTTTTAFQHSSAMIV